MINQDEFVPVELSELTNDELKNVYLNINEYEDTYQGEIMQEIEHRGLVNEFKSVSPVKKNSGMRYALVIFVIISTPIIVILDKVGYLVVKWELREAPWTLLILPILAIVLLIYDHTKAKKKSKNEPQSYE